MKCEKCELNEIFADKTFTNDVHKKTEEWKKSERERGREKGN